MRRYSPKTNIRRQNAVVFRPSLGKNLCISVDNLWILWISRCGCSHILVDNASPTDVKFTIVNRPHTTYSARSPAQPRRIPPQSVDNRGCGRPQMRTSTGYPQSLPQALWISHFSHRSVSRQQKRGQRRSAVLRIGDYPITGIHLNGVTRGNVRLITSARSRSSQRARR